MPIRSIILLILLCFAATTLEVSASETLIQKSLDKHTTSSIKLKKKNKKKILKFQLNLKRTISKSKRIVYPFA
jgi:hypothetical protein